MPNCSDRIDLDQKFLELALANRGLSDDPRAKVVPKSGVVAIITREDQIVGISANVLPPKLKAKYVRDTVEVDDSSRYEVIEHAERAVILNALLERKNLSGATLYCTRFPCSDCARAIIWSGIARLVVPAGNMGETKWKDSQMAALGMLRATGLVLDYLAVDPQTPPGARALIHVSEFESTLHPE